MLKVCFCLFLAKIIREKSLNSLPIQSRSEFNYDRIYCTYKWFWNSLKAKTESTHAERIGYRIIVRGVSAIVFDVSLIIEYRA